MSRLVDLAADVCYTCQHPVQDYLGLLIVSQLEEKFCHDATRRRSWQLAEAASGFNTLRSANLNETADSQFAQEKGEIVG